MARGGGGGGGPPKVELRVERMGRHFLCRVANLEAYEVDAAEFGRACSKRFAASASVQQGAKGPEVQVQGNLTEQLPELLRSEYGVPLRSIAVDLGKGMQKKKKKK